MSRVCLCFLDRCSSRRGSSEGMLEVGDGEGWKGKEERLNFELSGYLSMAFGIGKHFGHSVGVEARRCVMR